MQPDISSTLKSIATVTAVAGPAYRIELAGIEEVADHETYHLRLHPLYDATRHNLRDLWVDTGSYDLWEAHYLGEYQPNPSSQRRPSDVTVYFKPIIEYWIVSRTVFNYQEHLDSNLSVFDVRTLDIAFPKSLPDWLFDAAEYKQHREARDPDIIKELLETPSPSPSSTP
jgi:hypothetical protein